jgi:hypothetical protein
MSEKAARLDIDPDAPPRKPSSRRCLFWISCLLNVLAAGWIVYFISSNFLADISFLRFPHSAHYQNTTLKFQPLAGSVIRPLIDAQQIFDIAITVWVRATEEQEGYRRSIPDGVNSNMEDHPWDIVDKLYVIVPLAIQEGMEQRRFAWA